MLEKNIIVKNVTILALVYQIGRSIYLPVSTQIEQIEQICWKSCTLVKNAKKVILLETACGITSQNVTTKNLTTIV
jgi:hypothetical protein